MLGLLHTAPAQVAAFAAELDAADPAVPACHAVEAALLAGARAAGAVTPALAGRVAAAVDGLRARGARVVLCTCSTIGAAAEATSRATAPVLRVDRPMAEAAVRAGERLAVLAALPSTLAPTVALLREAAATAGRVVEIRTITCEPAWAAFERGAREDYLAQVATAARAAATGADVLVLAQASMAPAAACLADLPLPVLSSPRLGVTAALRAWRALA